MPALRFEPTAFQLHRFFGSAVSPVLTVLSSRPLIQPTIRACQVDSSLVDLVVAIASKLILFELCLSQGLDILR